LAEFFTDDKSWPELGSIFRRLTLMAFAHVTVGSIYYAYRLPAPLVVQRAVEDRHVLEKPEPCWPTKVIDARPLDSVDSQAVSPSQRAGSQAVM
jgi:hypothetical protein